jgi:hypothetical protein
MIFAVSFMNAESFTPGTDVSTVPSGPRYSIGANGFGSHVSCAALPPGRKMWNERLSLGRERSEITGQRILLLLSAELEEVAHGQAEPSDEPAKTNSRRLTWRKWAGSSNHVTGLISLMTVY